jgi:hypothetical protein
MDQLNSDVEISASSFTGTLTGIGGGVKAGGILGTVDGFSDDATIVESYAAGTIHAVSQSGGDAYAGGIAGYGANDIENCYTAATVGASASSGNAYAGGIIGELSLGVTGVGKCYALGRVSADGGGIYAGGIAGRRDGSSIENCVALADVDGTGGSFVGRVIGEFGNGNYTVTNNYAAPDNSISGGGGIDGDTTIFIADFQGQANEGKYTALSWTFNTPWKWLSPYPYPVLHWQETAPDIPGSGV